MQKKLQPIKSAAKNLISLTNWQCLVAGMQKQTVNYSEV